jgi:GT2 family glycosyltransferase
VTGLPGGPALSVIVPHLNQPEFLGACLRSLEEQATQAEVEIIVVDNGSRELPTVTCRSFAGVRLETEATPGPGAARNKGIGVSHAPILAFIDADCLADPNWIAAILSAFADPKTQVIGGDVRIALADPGRMTMLEAYESVYAYRQKEYIERQGFSGTGNLAMRSDVYQQVGPFAGIGVAEDREWGRRATRMGFRTEYRPDMIVYHPARKSMDELKTKWNRHTAHDFAEQVKGPVDRVKWLVKALALAISPLAEVVRIALSDRIATPRERVLAFRALFLIRQHRAKVALLELLATKQTRASHTWNRE